MTSIAATSSSSYLFEFLHAEIIRYQNQCHADREEKVKKWINGMSEYPQIDKATLNAQVKLIKKNFVQGNAETKLEALGHRVGYILVEKVAKDLPRLSGELDSVKFVCKEFWTAAFGKQVDNLRTNHQGAYMVQDNKFFIVTSFAEGKQYVEHSAIYLAFPCGVIRGALSNLGITSLVTSTVDSLPVVKFHIHVQQKS